jgi:hypothetical protein
VWWPMDSLARSGDVWHNGADLPTCVGTDTTTRTHVQLGIVDIDSSGSDDVNVWTESYVAWLRCLA